MAKTCCWVISPAKTENGEFIPAVYCGKKTSYKIVKDDDENKVRKYNLFCDEHEETLKIHIDFYEEEDL